MKLRTKRRRKTPFWAMRAVASQRRDPHNYDFSGCQAVSRSCNLKGAPKKHARCGGTSGVALICLAARLGFSFPKEKRFWNLGVPHVVPRPSLTLAGRAPHQHRDAALRCGLWHGPSSAWALHFQPLPSLFSVQIEYQGLCMEQQYFLFNLRVGFSFLWQGRQQGCQL